MTQRHEEILILKNKNMDFMLKTYCIIFPKNLSFKSFVP